MRGGEVFEDRAKLCLLFNGLLIALSHRHFYTVEIKMKKKDEIGKNIRQRLQVMNEERERERDIQKCAQNLQSTS